jgi:hypothetical protein
VAKEAQRRLRGAEPADSGRGHGLRGQRTRRGPHADLGIAAGKQRGHLFIKGKIVRVVPEDEMVEALVEEAKMIMAEGVEARLAARDEGRRSRGRGRPRDAAR